MRYKTQLGHEYKILLDQYERDKLSIPDAVPSQTLILAKTLFESQKEQVKELLTQINRVARRLNIEKCTGKSPAAKRYFWAFVTNKTKMKSDITSVLDEATGIIKSNPHDVLMETELHLKRLFEGEFDHIESPLEGQNLHNYSIPLIYTPAPTDGESHPQGTYHSYTKATNPKLSSRDSSKTPDNDPAGFLNANFTFDEVRESISQLQNNKSRGWDNIPNEAFKYAPVEVVQHHVLMFNTMKDCNQVPKKFNEGKVTLIHKKGPEEILSNYRPLTVNSAMYGIYSRILNDRLKKVTEAHDLLGEVQAGFRKDRNAGDNLFVLSTILAKAKENGQLVHKAFVDITKAYDTVSRDLLWTKLENLGFGKVFINCLKALYTDDYIKASVNGRNTRNIYLSRGVRQGCSLSPLLFALYISDLGHELCSSGQGFDVSDANICSLFFADDIILLSPTAGGLRKLLAITQRHFKSLKLGFSRSKTQVISPSTTDFTVFDYKEEEVFTLQKVVEYKYLGLQIHKSLFKTVVERQKKAIKTANQFKGACLSIAFRGPDVSILASCLWLNVAIPTILYGCESIPFSETHISSLNRIQSQLAKGVLGVPISSPNFVAQTELGFKHFSHTLWSLQLNAYLRWRDMTFDRWPKKAMLEHLSGNWDSKYFKYISTIKNTIGLPFIYSQNMIAEYLNNHFINRLNDEVTKSKLPAYRQVASIQRNTFIHEGPSSALAVGMKVNNCKNNPTQGIDHSKSCKFCPGQLASEFHVAWKCPKLSKLRKDLGINIFKNTCSLQEYRDDMETYYLYINGMDSSGNLVTCLQFDERVKVLSEIRTQWFTLQQTEGN